MACEGKKKGKVFFVDKGSKQEVDVPIAPFSVTCSAVGTCGKSGIRTITYDASNPSAPHNNSFSFPSFENEVVFFKAVPSPGTYDGNQYDFWGTCPGGEREIHNSFSRGSGAISISNNTFVVDGEAGLIIRDSLNKILFKILVLECNYSISCDKNCPDVFCECPVSGYPGYCCLDCKSTAGQIHSITEDLRGRNGR